MQYFVKNESGAIFDVPKWIYEERLEDDSYECWTEDPYKELPDEVTENVLSSGDYTVKEAKEMAEDMTDQELEQFIDEGEDRKGILELLD